MKKLLMTLFLVLASPIMLASASVEAPSGPAPYDNPYQNQAGFNNQDSPQDYRHIKFLTDQGPRDPQDSFSLDSSEFGLFGPLSFTSTYSKVYGWILTGQFTQSLSDNNAISLLGDVGQKERRINATWGFAPTLHQRFKATAEYLTQKMDFNFYSGDVDRWEGQQAYGLTYQYLIAKSIVNDVSLNTFYSKANSYGLANKLYDNDQLINLRRIAGGTDESASAGVDLAPFKSSLVGLQLNYDDVDYDTQYQNNQNVSGIGATISLQQLLTHRLKLKLLASDRKPVNSYETELDYLVKTQPGTRLEFGVSGTRSIAEGGLSNDTQMGLNVNYAWGGADTKQAEQENGYSVAATDSASNLTQWTATPAVKMNQVYAVVDQAVESAGGSNFSALAAPTCTVNWPTVNTGYEGLSLQIIPGKKINEDLGVLSAQKGVAGINPIFFGSLLYPVDQVDVKGLPPGLSMKVILEGSVYHLYLQGQVVAGTPKSTVLVTASNEYTRKLGPCEGEKNTQTFDLEFGPSMTFNPATMPWEFKTGVAITNHGAAITANGGNITSVTVTPDGSSDPLSDFGISTNAATIKGAATGDLTVTGTPTAVTSKTETYDVTVKNSDGETGTGQFSLDVKPGPPAIKMDATKLTYNDSGVVPSTPNADNTFATLTSDVAPTVSFTSGKIADYGLSVHAEPVAGSANTYKVILEGRISKPTDTTQKYTLKACAGTGNCTEATEPLTLAINGITLQTSTLPQVEAKHGESIARIPVTKAWETNVKVVPTDAPPTVIYAPDTAAAAGCSTPPTGMSWNGTDAFSGTIADTATAQLYHLCVDAEIAAVGGTASIMGSGHVITPLNVTAPEIKMVKTPLVFNNHGHVPPAANANNTFATVTASAAPTVSFVSGSPSAYGLSVEVEKQSGSSDVYNVYLAGNTTQATATTQKYTLKACVGTSCSEATEPLTLAVNGITFSTVKLPNVDVERGQTNVTAPADSKWQEAITVEPTDLKPTIVFEADNAPAAGCTAAPKGLNFSAAAANYSGTVDLTAAVGQTHPCIDAEIAAVGGTGEIGGTGHLIVPITVLPAGAPVITDVKDLTFNRFTGATPNTPTVVTPAEGTFAKITYPQGSKFGSATLTGGQNPAGFGLTEALPSSASSDAAALSGTLTAATSNVQAYTLKVCNDATPAACSTAIVHLRINGTPVMPKTRLGSGNINVSQTGVNLPLDVSGVAIVPIDANPAPPAVTQYNLLDSSTVGCANLPAGLTLSGGAAPVIAGSLESTVTAGTYPICITAKNAVGTSENHGVYTLKVGGEAGAPQVTVTKSALNFTDKQVMTPADSTFATVTLAAGQTIQSAELVNGNAVSNYGLTLVHQADSTANTYSMSFTGAATPATNLVQHYTLRVCDSTGKCGDGNVALSIHSTPHFTTTNVGGANVKVGDATSLPLNVSASHFQTPKPTDNQSAIVSYAEDTTTIDCDNPADYGLALEGTASPEFTGTVKAGAKSTPVFCVTATNALGQKSDNVGRFSLSVDASAAPSVKLDKANLNFDNGQVVSDADGAFATVTASSAPQVTFKTGSASEYGLSLHAVAGTTADTYTVSLAGTITKATATTQTYTLHVCNADGSDCVDSSGQLNLAINGVPSFSGNVAAPGATGQGESNVVLPVNLASVTLNQPTDNPLPLTYQVDSTDAACEDPGIIGLHYNNSVSSPALVGNVPNEASIKAYTICFTAKNRVGTSTGHTQYTVNLTASTPPSVEHEEPIPPFANGEAANEANSTFATINSGSGQINWSAVTADPKNAAVINGLKAYGLTLGFAATASNGYEYNLFLTGTASKPTPTVQTYELYVHNTYDSPPIKVTFKVIIQSRPYFTSQSVGSHTGISGQTVTLATTPTIANDPTGADAPATLPATYKVVTPSGCTNPATIGLAFNGSGFTGTLPNVASSTSYTLCIAATNKVGESTDYNSTPAAGNAYKYGEYSLTINPNIQTYHLTCPTIAQMNAAAGGSSVTVSPTIASTGQPGGHPRTFHENPERGPIPHPRSFYGVTLTTYEGQLILVCQYAYDHGYYPLATPTPALPANTTIPGGRAHLCATDLQGCRVTFTE